MRILDSHTGGEPTRIVVDDQGLLSGRNSAAECRDFLEREADWVRTTLTSEPRSAPWTVGAIVTPAPSSEHCCGVVFFNNETYLGMCGHGLIGLVETLAHLGKIGEGEVLIDTPAGDVTATRFADGSVAVRNVRSFRRAKNQAVNCRQATVIGDIAYGGNWFFLVEDEAIGERGVVALTQRAKEIAECLSSQGIVGDDDAQIDHIEFYGPPRDPQLADSQNFVLCPGGEVDRSPCGTGTSAKIACLAADGRLAPGETWRQQSPIGSIFTASYELCEGGVLPLIRGRAFVTADCQLIRDKGDALRDGFQLTSPRFIESGASQHG